MSEQDCSAATIRLKTERISCGTGAEFTGISSGRYSLWRKTCCAGFSLQIKPGEILGIVGESGSGKSTVIRAAMGLLGDGGRVSNGQILYQDTDMTKAQGEELRQLRGAEIGMIFQNAAHPSVRSVRSKSSYMKRSCSTKLCQKRKSETGHCVCLNSYVLQMGRKS